MPPSKKRKISVPTETDKEASQGPEHPVPETTQSEEQRPTAIESLVPEADQDAGNMTITNKERQERFKALQARAVGIPYPPTPASYIAGISVATATNH